MFNIQQHKHELTCNALKLGVASDCDCDCLIVFLLGYTFIATQPKDSIECWLFINENKAKLLGIAELSMYNISV